MRAPTPGYIDHPAAILVQDHISYQGVTTAAGNAGGTTLVCAQLAAESSYDGLVLKILDGGAAGQARPIQVHNGNTLTVGVGFTNSAGAAQQIAASVRFVILTSMAGGGGPGPSPEESLSYYGVVDAVPGANQFTISALAGLGAGKFAGVTNPYAAFVLRDAGGASAAPQGQIQQITAYTTATGVFTTGAFTAAVAVGDEILIVHPALAAALLAPLIVASGTFDTSSATVPADSTRTEANNHFRGMLLIPTAGAMLMRATRIVQYTGVGGIFTVDPNNPFPAATGLVTYVVVRDQTEFVPAGGGANNRTPSDVIGMKDEVIPAMNVAPTAVTTDTIVHHVKAILERVGATPADPDDSLLTSVGQRDAAATLDDLTDITTTDVEAKLRRILLRLSSNAFTADIQGVARTELDTMLAQLATYISALGAAYSAAVNPGAVAKTNIEQTLEDLGDVLAGAGITTFPAAAPPADGISMAEVLREIYNLLAASDSTFQEQADTAVNITAIAAGETNVLNLAVAATRYIVRSLNLKSADPGANVVTVRLYELINDVSTVVATFTINAANWGLYHSLVDMFGKPYLAGDNLRVTVQASAGGPYAITGQYSSATAT